jgi:copper chaperone CopZ
MEVIVEMKHLLARTAVAALVGTGMALILAVVPMLEAGQAKQEQPKKNATCTLNVEGMTCGGCAAAVKMAAKKVTGVADADVSYEKGRAVVTYDPAKTTPETIAKAVADGTGFKAEVQKQK